MADAKPTLSLLTYKGNARCMAAKVIAAYAGVKLDEPAFEFGQHGDGANKSPAYLRNAHPLGKVPVLETPEGCLFESNAIARYLARLGKEKGLYGETDFQMAQVDQWLDFAAAELAPPTTMLLGPLTNLLPHNAPQEEQAQRHIFNCFLGLDTWLETRTYFVGERLTAADISLTCAILPLFQHYFSADALRPYTNLMRWFNLCINQPTFQTVLAPGKLLEGKKAVAKEDKKKGNASQETPLTQPTPSTMAMPPPPPTHPSTRTGNVPSGSIGPLPGHMADLGSPERMRIGSPAECLANSPTRLRSGVPPPVSAMPPQSAVPAYSAAPPQGMSVAHTGTPHASYAPRVSVLGVSKTLTANTQASHSIPQFPQQLSKVSAPYHQGAPPPPAPQFSRAASPPQHYAPQAPPASSPPPAAMYSRASTSPPPAQSHFSKVEPCYSNLSRGSSLA